MSPAAPLEGPELLTGSHELGAFDCGKAALNAYLERFALANQLSGTARTYVAHRGGRVVGYYSLAAAAVEAASAPARLSKGLARHPIPLTLLARLAVDKAEQGSWLGSALLTDAFKKFLLAQEIVASRALLVHAKDEEAAGFYRRYGFDASHIDAYRLYMLTKDIKKTLAR